MSFDKPFISVIVPIRNEEKRIEECLTSIVEQDYGLEHFEVLVVDGMSDDQTVTIVKRFQKKYANVILLTNPRKYVSFALNAALRVARGELIARVDGHAAIEKDYLTQCVKVKTETGAECVGGQITSVNETRTGRAIALAMSSNFGVGNSRFRTAGHDGYVDSLAFGVYHRDVFRQIGLFDESMVRCQDDEFNFRLRKHGGRVYLTSRMRCKYYPRSSLKKLWKQYFGYGFFKVRLFQKYPFLMQLRHFVPLAFVLALLGSALLWGLAGLAWPLLSLLLAYSLGCLVFVLRLCARHGFEFVFLLPVIFATLHLSYGAGFLWGLIKFTLARPQGDTVPAFSETIAMEG